MSRFVQPRIAAVVGAALGVAMAPLPASAHTGQITSGLTSGLTHPLIGPDHLLAMVAVGIVAVTLDAAVVVPATFVASMVAGGTLGMLGVPFPFTEAAIAVSVVALGGAVVAGESMRANVALALVAVAGLVHGHAHGAEAPLAAHPAVYVLGFVLATVGLHASGVAVGVGIRRRPAVRTTLGTLVAAAGVGLLVALT